MSKYRPIDCKTYGEFERAIVAGRRLRISWRDEQGLDHLETVQPTDLETCRGEEFLHASSENGMTFRLRLDRISKAERAVGHEEIASLTPLP